MTKIIRQPDYAGGGITAEEKAAMEQISQEWIEIARTTDTVDRDAIDAAIRDLYRAVDLPQPLAVVVAPSPLVMAMAYGASAAIWYKRGKTLEATRRATDQATDEAIEGGSAQAVLELSGQFGLLCAQKWWRPYQGGAYWASTEAYLVAARDVLGLRLPSHDKYAAWEQCARLAPFRIMHEKFCIVSDFPEILRWDDENRPHCEDGPSHRWRDGWELYYWHGVRVPREWIMDKASLTPTIALTHENVEMRRAACEIIGWHRILDELNAKTINRDDDPEVGELVEVEIPEIGRERFIRVRCGTGRDFALPVPPEMTTALEANAWTYGIDPEDLRAKEHRT